jgi:hypothetical protein
MTDYDDERQVELAFARFTEEGAGQVVAPGVDEVRYTVDDVRHTVGRRRRVRITTVAVAAGVAALLPFAVSARPGRSHPDLSAASASASPQATTASPDVSASPSLPTSAPPPRTTTSSSGVISLSQLTAAPVGVPVWLWSGSENATCSSGRIRLQPTGDVTGSRVGVVDLISTNLDDDAAPETAALLRCGYGAEQVVAFDRDDAGTIITLGQVTATTPNTRAILDVAPRAKGGLTATVADTRASDDQRRQERSYAWRDGRYVQVGGPASFPEPSRPVDLGLTVGTPVAATVSGSCEGVLRDISVTFTVTNHSKQTSGRFYLEWRGGAFLPNGSYDGPDWLDTPGYPALNDGHRGLARGETVHLTFKFKMDACATKWGFTTEIHTDTPDPDPSNNSVVWNLQIK